MTKQELLQLLRNEKDKAIAESDSLVKKGDQSFLYYEWELIGLNYAIALVKLLED